MPGEPNIDFGNPVIFFDSHPEEQESYLYSYWSSLKMTLQIAWTGNVPKQLLPGTLRIIWWTNEGHQGLKDYELHEHVLVRNNFDGLLKLPEIRRCLVTGFSGQNPYIGYGAGTPWGGMDNKFTRDRQMQEYWAHKTVEKPNGDNKKSVIENIDAVIRRNEELEKEKERLRSADKEDV